MPESDGRIRCLKSKHLQMAQRMPAKHLKESNGIAGYRRTRIHLTRKGIEFSALTVHKYMNTELDLRSIVRRKSPR